MNMYICKYIDMYTCTCIKKLRDNVSLPNFYTYKERDTETHMTRK